MQAVDTAVTIPRSAAEAVEAFGDGDGVTVIAGATVLQPLLNRGRLRPERALLLHAAGMDEVAADGDTITLGATATLADIAAAAPEPLASAARINDPEIRAQATVRTAGPGGERTEPIEDFLASRGSRLVLEVSFARPRTGAYLAQHRTHSASNTLMAVAVADTGDGIAVAVGGYGGGFGEHGVRCPSVERALAEGADHATAAAAARDDVTAHDDSLAPAWYRERVLPVLITRALRAMEDNA